MADLLVEALRSIEAPDEQLVRLGLLMARTDRRCRSTSSPRPTGSSCSTSATRPPSGVVRLAPKVLRDGAELLARSTTYAAASFGLQVGGGSAGINAKPDDRDAARRRLPRGGRPSWSSPAAGSPGPGVGIAADDLAGLPRGRERAPPPSTRSPPARARSPPPSAPSARSTASGSPSSAPAPSPRPPPRRPPPTAPPSEPEAAFDADCDVLLVAGKAGVLEHDLAATVKAKVVVPLTPVPVTARALAILGRAGVVVVPDFLATAGAAARRPRPRRRRPDGPGPRRRGRARRRGHRPLDGRGHQGRGPPAHLAGRAALRPPARPSRVAPVPLRHPVPGPGRPGGLGRAGPQGRGPRLVDAHRRRPLRRRAWPRSPR